MLSIHLVCGGLAVHDVCYDLNKQAGTPPVEDKLKMTYVKLHLHIFKDIF